MVKKTHYKYRGIALPLLFPRRLPPQKSNLKGHPNNLSSFYVFSFRLFLRFFSSYSFMHYHSHRIFQVLPQYCDTCLLLSPLLIGLCHIILIIICIASIPLLSPLPFPSLLSSSHHLRIQYSSCIHYSHLHTQYLTMYSIFPPRLLPSPLPPSILPLPHYNINTFNNG